jgi:hypothetical protein
MDYLAKMIEDGVVDNPPSCGQLLLTMSLPSPLMERTRPALIILSSAVDSRSFRKLYKLLPLLFQVHW